MTWVAAGSPLVWALRVQDQARCICLIRGALRHIGNSAVIYKQAVRGPVRSSFNTPYTCKTRAAHGKTACVFSGQSRHARSRSNAATSTWLDG